MSSLVGTIISTHPKLLFLPKKSRYSMIASTPWPVPTEIAAPIPLNFGTSNNPKNKFSETEIPQYRDIREAFPVATSSAWNTPTIPPRIIDGNRATNIG